MSQADIQLIDNFVFHRGFVQRHHVGEFGEIICCL